MIGGDRDVGVGFRLDKAQPVVSDERPSLLKLLTEFALEDLDADIIIGNDSWQSPFQIARLVETGKGSTSYQRLKSVLEKKMLVQPDPKLELAILINESFNLNYDEIHDFLVRISVPYGRICLIGKTGSTPELGQFQRIEIFPEVNESQVIKIHFIEEP
jgi:hypothetical protein